MPQKMNRSAALVARTKNHRKATPEEQTAPEAAQGAVTGDAPPLAVVENGKEVPPLPTLEELVRAVIVLPVGYWVLTKVVTPNRTKSGFILPTHLKKGTQRWARIVAVGDGEWSNGTKVEIPLRVGDLCVLKPEAGEPIVIGRGEYVIINYREIFFSVQGDGGAMIPKFQGE